MRMRRFGWASVLAGALLVPTVGVGATPAVAPRTVAIIGDTPYGSAKLAEFPQLVAKINQDAAVSQVTHLGDIKNGSSVCSDAYFGTVRALFDTFQDPLVYTPGDNEWTDCHRTNNGAYFPLERLAKVRQVFFPVPGQTLGITKEAVATQAAAGFPAFVENTRWTEAGAVFVALNVPGSNNDLVPWTNVTPAQAAQQQGEFDGRERANTAWLSSAFVAATNANAPGIVIAIQADMWDDTAALSGYDAFVHNIAALSVRFRKPVLLLEGDSHVFRVDHPFTVGDPLYSLHPLNGLSAPNVTRIVVEGSTNPTEYLRLKVDPSSPAVFSWTRVPL